jgi:transposase
MLKGGKRLGAGRPEVLLYNSRILKLTEDGYSQRAIAAIFRVSQPTIGARIKKLKSMASA